MCATTEVGPVEEGVRMFLAKTAHEDPALSALALAGAKAVDVAEPGTRSHSLSVEALRKVLSALSSSVKPQREVDDEFADLFRGVFSG